MLKINDWIIIELSNFVLNGLVTGQNHYSDKLLLIKDGYAVTERSIYKLGNPDKVWIATQQGKERLKEFS